MHLVDTDVLIDVWRGHPPAVEWFAGCSELPHVSGFVVMELLQDARDREEVRKALKLVEPLPIVWPSPSECARALSDFVSYRLSHGLGLLDGPHRGIGDRTRGGAVHLQRQALPFSSRATGGAAVCALIRRALETHAPNG